MDQLQPHRNPAANFQAAIRSFGARDWTNAEALCRQLLLVNPSHANALHLLGLVLAETGRSQDGVARLREASVLQPANAVLWMNLGEAHRKAGQFAEAVECHGTAIFLQENFPEAQFHLALAFRDLGQFQNAIAAADRASKSRPGYADAHYLLGNLLREDGRLERAVAAYQMALQIRPNWSDAHLNIAAAKLELQEPAQALDHYREVLRLEPARSEAENSMGHALMALGRVEEAKAVYAQAAGGGSSYRDRMGVLLRETLPEVIPPDQAWIAQYKARVTAALQEFAAEPSEFDPSDLRTHGAAPSAMLAYCGGNLRPIMEQWAGAIGPPIPRPALRARQGKPKLGIVVTDHHEGVYQRCWGGIAERLSRKSFDVRVVCSRAGANILQTKSQIPENEYLRLPAAIDEAARVLREQEFDWLHYWEIGTDTMNYYLPFFRSAPGQSTGYGWPVTSGNPYVSSYLSCRQVEPADGQLHYSEQLILFERFPIYAIRPVAPPGGWLPRTHFGLEDGAHVYLCMQNLRKFHPDFDPLLADLLRSDPQGLLLINTDRQTHITDLLLNRFRRTMPDVLSRVRVMPRRDYLSLVAVSDVTLDTVHYSGTQTVYDSVAVGTPMITLPGEFHRSRWAAAINRRLGLPQLIASTPQEYVATAVEVANDPDLRQALRQQILEAGAELFEDAAVVSEHDAYFSAAIAASRAG